MPEPAGTNRYIAFRRQPLGGVTLPAGRLLSSHVARRCRTPIFADGVEGRPAGVPGDASFVAHPAHIGTYVAEHHGLGLHGADHFPGARPVIVSVLVDGALLF